MFRRRDPSWGKVYRLATGIFFLIQSGNPLPLLALAPSSKITDVMEEKTIVDMATVYASRASRQTEDGYLESDILFTLSSFPSVSYIRPDSLFVHEGIMYVALQMGGKTFYLRFHRQGMHGDGELFLGIKKIVHPSTTLGLPLADTTEAITVEHLLESDFEEAALRRPPDIQVQALRNPKEEMPEVFSLMKNANPDVKEWRDMVSKFEAKYNEKPYVYLGGMATLVARDESTGEMIGAMQFALILDIPAHEEITGERLIAPAYMIHLIGVPRQFRGKGVATRLIMAVENLAESEGKGCILAQTLPPIKGEAKSSYDLFRKRNFRPSRNEPYTLIKEFGLSGPAREPVKESATGEIQGEGFVMRPSRGTPGGDRRRHHVDFPGMFSNPFDHAHSDYRYAHIPDGPRRPAAATAGGNDQQDAKIHLAQMKAESDALLRATMALIGELSMADKSSASEEVLELQAKAGRKRSDLVYKKMEIDRRFIGFSAVDHGGLLKPRWSAPDIGAIEKLLLEQRKLHDELASALKKALWVPTSRTSKKIAHKATPAVQVQEAQPIAGDTPQQRQTSVQLVAAQEPRSEDLGYPVTAFQEKEILKQIASASYVRRLQSLIAAVQNRQEIPATTFFFDHKGNPVAFHQGPHGKEFDTLLEVLLRNHEQGIWAHGLPVDRLGRLPKKSWHLKKQGHMLRYDKHQVLPPAGPPGVRVQRTVSLRLIKSFRGRSVITHFARAENFEKSVLKSMKRLQRVKQLNQWMRQKKSEPGLLVVALVYAKVKGKWVTLTSQPERSLKHGSEIWEWLAEAQGNPVQIRNQTVNKKVRQISFLLSKIGWRVNGSFRKGKELDWQLSFKKNGLEIRVTYQKDRGKKNPVTYLYVIPVEESAFADNEIWSPVRAQAKPLIRVASELPRGSVVYASDERPDEHKVIMDELTTAGIVKKEKPAEMAKTAEAPREMSASERLEKMQRDFGATSLFDLTAKISRVRGKGLIVFFDAHGQVIAYHEGGHSSPEFVKKLLAIKEKHKDFWIGGLKLNAGWELEDFPVDAKTFETYSYAKAGFNKLPEKEAKDKKLVALHINVTETDVKENEILLPVETVSYRGLDQIFRGEKPGKMIVVPSDKAYLIGPGGKETLVDSHPLKLSKKHLLDRIKGMPGEKVRIAGPKAIGGRGPTTYVKKVPREYLPRKYWTKRVSFEVPLPELHPLDKSTIRILPDVELPTPQPKPLPDQKNAAAESAL